MAATPQDRSIRHGETLGELTEEQRTWALHSEGLWRSAHELVRANPSVDPGDVYHALRCLERSPTERLRRGLGRGRLRAHAR
jgi:hypothetical protein